MVDRREITPRECVIVDFDNTLININSTLHLLKFLLKKTSRRKDLSSVLSLFNIILKRKLKIISHSKLKFMALEMATVSLSESDWEEFAKSLLNNVNHDVVKILNGMNEEGYDIILATGAAEIIFPHFLKMFNPFPVKLLSTKLTPCYSNFKENRGEEKLRNVKAYLQQTKSSCHSVISDHSEDLPLFKISSGNNYLINPSKNSLLKIKKEFPHLKASSLGNSIYKFGQPNSK